jgi:hypothetical protein
MPVNRRVVRVVLIVLGCVLIIVGNVTVAAQADPKCPAVGRAGSEIVDNNASTSNWFLFIVGILLLVCVAAAWGRGQGRREANNQSNTTI